MLLIYPPQAKPSEPPAGLPLLAAAIRANGSKCTVCDMNIEGFYSLISHPPSAEDTWSRRALKHCRQHLQDITEQELYRQPDRYKRAVADVNRILEIAGKKNNIVLSLANYQDQGLSPQKSDDLIQSAENHGDNLYFSYFSARLSELIEHHSPQHVGFSLNYLSQALCTFAMIGFLRKHYPSLSIFLGGGLVTTWTQNPKWRNPFGAVVDHLISGPGEQQILEIVGLAGSGNRVCPDYFDLRYNKYLAPGFILPYATSTGCYWRKCSFCPETSEENPYAPVGAQTAQNEVHALVEQTQPSLIHFLDNAISPAFMEILGQSDFNIPWYGFVRFTHHLTDPDFCRMLRSSGCVMLNLGLESGSQKVLDEMAKGVKLTLVDKALACLHETGILTYVYLLFGTPAESLTEARQTLGFVTAHSQHIDFLNLAVFNLPTCSPQVADLDCHEFYQGDLSIYMDFQHPLNWGRMEIRRFLDGEFRRQPAIQKILQNDPPHFTSNHAPFFNPVMI